MNLRLSSHSLPFSWIKNRKLIYFGHEKHINKLFPGSFSHTFRRACMTFERESHLRLLWLLQVRDIVKEYRMIRLRETTGATGFMAKCMEKARERRKSIRRLQPGDTTFEVYLHCSNRDYVLGGECGKIWSDNRTGCYTNKNKVLSKKRSFFQFFMDNKRNQCIYTCPFGPARCPIFTGDNGPVILTEIWHTLPWEEIVWMEDHNAAENRTHHRETA